VSVKLSHHETTDFDRQATMVADLAAFLHRHQPGSASPVPPVPYQINRWSIAVRLEPDDIDYAGEDFFGVPRRSRAQAAYAWATALGMPVTRHRWSDGRLELVVTAAIGKPRNNGMPRTPISIRTVLNPGDSDWLPPGHHPHERDVAQANAAADQTGP
jgi:hypothetical protein